MVKRLLFILILTVLSGCQSVAYYVQSINGQWELTEKRRPLEKLISDPDTPEKLRQRLQLAQRIRAFAITDLALPDNRSYRYYADLGRSRVVWNVFATPPLSLVPKRWCFPVAGCVSYRGYFHEADALAFARRLQGEGDDVVVRGTTAYSTLGWFDDPLLNTFIYRGDADLAGHVFHELAHQVVYVKNDTAFNESFAMAVEEEGVKRWLQQSGDDASWTQWQTARKRTAQFIDLLLKTRKRLQGIYASDHDDAEKRQLKSRQLARLRQEYAALTEQWGGYRGFDRWFDGELNNAFFVPVNEYYGWLPAFRALLNQSADMRAFYRKAGELAALDKADRNRRLAVLKNNKTALDRRMDHETGSERGDY